MAEERRREILFQVKNANFPAKMERALAFATPATRSFGFGLMDAKRMVTLAKDWKKVPQQQRYEVYFFHHLRA